MSETALTVLVPPVARPAAHWASEAETVSTLHVRLMPEPGAEGARLFGRYRRERELGRGGMGVVLLARDEVLGIPLALKLVPEAVSSSEEHLEGLRKEVLRGMALTHPGIVRVFSFERDASSAAIVMEYVDGESLADLKARQPGGCFEPDDLRPILEQLCAVLDYAHGEARIVHRDLKPRNLMMTREGRLKVADFGIASSLSETMAGISIRSDSSGTPPYMSPQQTMGERPTVADDIYSLGATLYDLLTGKPPFYRGNVITQVLQEAPATLGARRAELGVTGRPAIPAQWERMISACLAKDPASRPPSGAALLKLLDTSPHALVPYAPRVEIPVESLRLDLTLAKREETYLEGVEVPVEIVPIYRRQVKVLKPESILHGMMTAFGEEFVEWGRRLISLGMLIGVFVGVFVGVHWLQRHYSDQEPEGDMSAPPRIVLPPSGQVRVEVRYVPTPGAPPPFQVILPPPPPMPPPPMMPPPPPRGRPH